MNYTSAQANKRLKKLTDEYVSLREKESRSREFRAAAGENVEAVRPAYDYADTQRHLAELGRYEKPHRLLPRGGRLPADGVPQPGDVSQLHRRLHRPSVPVSVKQQKESRPGAETLRGGFFNGTVTAGRDKIKGPSAPESGRERG